MSRNHLAEASLYDVLKSGYLLEKNGFTLEATHYGKWCGRSDYLSHQDILVLRKR
jgi:hypothetical protein